MTEGQTPILARNDRRELRHDVGLGKIRHLATSPAVVTIPPATQSAEITFWTRNAPATPTEELQENLSRVNSCGPRDKNGPTLVNHRRGRYVIKVGGVQRILKANVVPFRKPLLVVGDMLTTGHDVHFTA